MYYHSEIGENQTMKYFNQGILCYGRVSSKMSPYYKSRAFPPHQTARWGRYENYRLLKRDAV